MAYDSDIAERVRRWFHQRGVAVQEKKMMSGLCFMVDGKMCLGVLQDRLMLRLDPAEYDAALARPGCTPMDFTGRPMKGFVWVDMDAAGSEEGLNAWASLALEFNPRAKASAPAKKSRRKS